ncbi:hypothetical protein SLEP1_g18523 [Rubroshorea leprosula]|uniref:Uncharacterized protein n=1 Tax=Rubroshorea leprosula TaxID=152421 RepID=A0AAV5J6Q2_9ROSI|nr:hypothetical protein SLEP1_g18523 [Rubroshorea leprosula]
MPDYLGIIHLFGTVGRYNIPWNCFQLNFIAFFCVFLDTILTSTRYFQILYFMIVDRFTFTLRFL